MDSPLKLTLNPEDHGKIFAVAHEAVPPGLSLLGAHTIDFRCSYDRGREPVENRFRSTDPFRFMGMLDIAPIPREMGKRTLSMQGYFKSPQNTMTACAKFPPKYWTDVGSNTSSREMRLKVVEFAHKQGNEFIAMMSLYIVIFPDYSRTFNVLEDAKQI